MIISLFKMAFNASSTKRLLSLLLILLSNASLCQIYGSLELGVRSDSQDSSHNPQAKPVMLRHLGFINYQSQSKDTQAVFDYIIQQPDLSDSAISQLYIKHAFNHQNHVIAGRFNRFDNLGYYTLDGAQYYQRFQPSNTLAWQQNLRHFSVESYAGKPLRTDDIHVIEGDYVVGINSHFRWTLPTQQSTQQSENPNSSALFEPKLTNMPNDISAHIGYQALKINNASQRINLGLSAKSQQGFFPGQFRQEFNLSSSLATQDNQWADSDFEDLTLDARFYLPQGSVKSAATKSPVRHSSPNFIQVQYQYYQPELSRPSFKQRFYSTYAVGKIALAELAYHGSLAHETRFRLAARASDKQRGGKGYGIQAQVTQRFQNDWQLDASIDHLTLSNLEVSSIYGGVSLSPSAVSQLTLQGALQFEQKPLYGKNQLFGLQGSYQYMFNANLFLSCSLELLRNSNRDNDHLGRFYLVYYFDKDHRS